MAKKQQYIFQSSGYIFDDTPLVLISIYEAEDPSNVIHMKLSLVELNVLFTLLERSRVASIDMLIERQAMYEELRTELEKWNHGVIPEPDREKRDETE